MKKTRIWAALSLLLISAILLSTATFAWFALNTSVEVDGVKFEAYSDSLYLQVTENKGVYTTTSTSVTSTDPAKKITLSTYKVLTTGGMALTGAPAAGTSKYGEDDTKDALDYYEKVSNTIRGEITYDYIQVDKTAFVKTTKLDGLKYDVEFKFVSGVYYDPATASTATYYTKVDNNTYKEVDNSTLTAWQSLTGYYTLDTSAIKTVDTPNTYYTDGDTKVYYALETSTKTYTKQTNLDLRVGTDLAQYYVINADSFKTNGSDTDVHPVTKIPYSESGTYKDTKFFPVSSSGETYYVEDTTGGTVRYLSIGKFSNPTDLTNYVYWGTAHSDELDNAQVGNPIDIVDDVDSNNYFLKKTVWLQCGVGTNDGKNLKVDSVSVKGVESYLDRALTVLFVATNGDGQVSMIEYRNVTTGNKYFDTDGAVSNQIFFDTILGNAKEEVQVDIYVYYDGTDETAKTTSAIDLYSQEISVKFVIDEFEHPVNP